MNRILKEDIDAFTLHFPFAEKLRGKSLIITGATGLLGSCMVRCLLALNEKYQLCLHVIAVIRNLSKAELLLGQPDDTLSYYKYDFTFDTPFAPPATDYIIHFASPTASKYFIEHPIETLQTGVNGIETILEFARKNSTKSVAYISSMEVYGSVVNDEQILTEERQGYLDPMTVRSSYPMAKRFAECLCHAFSEECGVPVKTVRLAQTFGAGVSKDDHRVFAQFTRSVLEGKDIILYTKGGTKHCYCYTMDAMRGILYVLLKGQDGAAYNVANEHTYLSILELARFLCQEFKPNLKVRIELKKGMGYPPTTKLRLSTQKIQALGWRPEYNLKTMFGRLIRSMESE